MESTQDIAPPVTRGRKKKVEDTLGDQSKGDQSKTGQKGKVADTAELTPETSDGATSAVPTQRSAAAQKLRYIPVKPQVTPRAKVDITLRSLLEAGVHFGHQTSRWNPAMSPFIHSTRNGIHIINLPKTLQAWIRSRKSIVDIVGNGGKVLFVGTKKQAQDVIVQEATRCNSFYVSRRWLGGMITNFQTIRKSIDRMRKIDQILADEDELAASGQSQKYTKKERLMMSRELEKLDFSLGGIKDMGGLPDLLFVIDIRLEEIAVREARRSDIPVVALVDTNCDPAMVEHPIPSNDDGTRAIRMFAGAVADAVLEGQKIFAAKPAESRPSRKRRGGGGRDYSQEKPAELENGKVTEAAVTEADEQIIAEPAASEA